MSTDRIRTFIYENFPIAKARNIGDASQLLEEGVLDSLGILELVNYLQDELGIPIEDDELVPENFASIDAIASFVETKVEAKDLS